MSGLRIPTQLNYGPISKILNMQIKLAMYELFCEVMHDVLDGLNSELQNTKKTSWTTAFSAILILGIIVKDLEVAFDSMILSNILNNNHGCKNRIERVRYCQTLDDLLMGQWRSNSKKFNSIHDDLDKPTLMLIDVLESLGTAHNIEGQADRSTNPQSLTRFLVSSRRSLRLLPQELRTAGGHIFGSVFASVKTQSNRGVMMWRWLTVERGRRRLGLAMMEWQLWTANRTRDKIGYNPSVLYLPI